MHNAHCTQAAFSEATARPHGKKAIRYKDPQEIKGEKKRLDSGTFFALSMSQLFSVTFTTAFEACRRLLVKNLNVPHTNVGWSRIYEVPSKKTKEAVMLWMHWNLKVEENVGEEGNNEWSLRINLRSGSCSQPSSLVH